MTDPKAGYFLTGNRNLGCLLLHGFTSTPAELRPLADSLHQMGYSVYCPLLAGHGRSSAALFGIRYQDWLKTADSGYARLKDECSQVIVLGHSMGGLLALHLAYQYQLDGLVLLAAALEPTNWWLKYAKFFQYIVPYGSWKRKERPPHQQQYLLGYDRYPISSVNQLYQLIKATEDILPEIEVATLITQGTRDKTVRPTSVERISNQIRSKQKEIFWLEDTGHNLTVADNNIVLFAKIHEFISALEQSS